jgi:hypothetical protein
MRKTLITSIFVILAGILLGFIVVQWGGKIFSLSPFNNTSIKSPVDLDNPAIISANIIYNIQGTIKEVKKTGNQYVLTLDQLDNSFPPIYISDNTLVVTMINKKINSASIADLVAGKQVLVNMVYNIREKSFTTSRVSLPLSVDSSLKTKQQYISPPPIK